MKTPTVIVLGANGRFGAAAVSAFAAAGWRVQAQVRRAADRPLPAGATAVPIALDDTAALAAAAAGASIVVYAVNPLYTRWDEEALPLARLGMGLAEALGARFMLPGNVYNFGEDMPALLREDAPERPSTKKGRQRVALEAEMRQRAERGAMRATVIRAGDFFGAGKGNWFDQAIVKDIARGKLVYPGPLDVVHAWAYLPDLAKAFAALASRPQTEPFRTLHFAGHALTGRELLGLIAQAADELSLRPAAGFKQAGMPWGVIRTVGLVYPLWRELAGMSYLWRVPHALDGHSLESVAGPTPSTPARLALRRALLDLGHPLAPGAGVMAH